MAKILLVEDDNNLREIYEARLQAEGYEIVSAPDGETALAVAKKEQPDLVISDVMMPRISGFEMLDILRNTEGLRDVKVIMLTALGQAEDKTRADTLGADRYLVKSQVTLEDIVKSASDLLNGAPAPGTETPATAQAAAEMNAPVPTTVPNPVNVAAVPVAAAPAPAPVPAPAAPAPMPEPTTVAPPIAPMPEPTVPTTDPAAAVPAPQPMFSTPAVPAGPAVDPLASASVPEPATAAPTVEAPTPAPTPEPAPVPDTSALSAAVEDLINGTANESGEPTPAASTADPTQPATDAPAAADTSAPPVPADQAAPADTPEQDSATLVKKKIIQPLDPAAANPGQPVPANLHDLLAKEGLNHMGEPSGQSPAQPADTNAPAAADPTHPMHQPAPPHQPGHVISPNPTDQNGQPVDPNSISL
ncbi:MAG TPA: response regulator [Candidatus Saccharimonadales bacterium]|nr:response regulator [Candidatus Saccharimonadales bacterium]